LQSEGFPERTEVSLLLSDDATIQQLNRQYRDMDCPTDVLSFPQEDTKVLGDVVISLETAARQAVEYGTTLQEEVERLLAHGILHLFGYDHETAEDASIMEAREAKALGGSERLE
jgi:probable rRNA maturation factor